jgi:hypothetical protein
MKFLDDVPREERCYVVFRGTPSVYYITADNGIDALDAAQDLARTKTENTGEKYTVMCIPQDCLQFSLTAVNHGVVFHATNKLEEDSE